MDTMRVNELRRLESLTEFTQERLRRTVNYNPVTGVVTWIKPLSSRCKEEDVVGWWDSTKGYYMANIFGQRMPLHRLIWFYAYGVWTMVDHKDRDKSNNRLINLREATRQQNAANQSVRQTNILGVKGVQKRGCRYRAYITVDYHTLHLGTYDTIEEAVNARREAAIRYFGEFANEDQWAREAET